VETWLQYKREKRQGYKPTGFKALLKTISAMGEQEAIEAIDNSMAQSYVGIFAPSKQSQSKAKEPRIL
jgi:hypothetical protein